MLLTDARTPGKHEAKKYLIKIVDQSQRAIPILSKQLGGL